MHIVLVSVGVAALALLFLLLPAIGLQLALRLFAPPADCHTAMDDRASPSPAPAVAGRRLKLSRVAW